MKFGKLIFGKITRWHILKIKCTKFDFGWGRELTALPRPSRGLGYFLGKGGRKDWREGQGIEGENGGDLLLRQGEEKRGVEGYPQT